MSFSSRTGSWDTQEGFVHASTASTLAPMLVERPTDAAAGMHAVPSMDPLSGMLSPKRMRSEQTRSAYSADLSRALKSVVKVGGCTGQATLLLHGRLIGTAAAACGHASHPWWHLSTACSIWPAACT